MNEKELVLKVTIAVALLNVIAFFTCCFFGATPINAVLFIITFCYIALFVYANNIHNAKNKFKERSISTIKHFAFIAGVYLVIFAGVSFIKTDVGIIASLDLVLVLAGIAVCYECSGPFKMIY